MEDRTAQLIISIYLCLWGWILIIFKKDIDVLYPLEVIFSFIVKIGGVWNVPQTHFDYEKYDKID